MALRRTIVSSSTCNLFFSTPKTTLHSTKLPALSFTAKCLQFRRSLRCSANYKDIHHQHQQAVAARFPKPTEVPWQKDLCNTVHLMGIVGTPVEFKYLPTGKVVAWTRLGVKKSPTDLSWINLTFWDELAQVASQHVEKGHQIYVSGRMVSDAVENEGKVQTYYKVVVQQLNFVERISPSAALYDRDSNNMTAGRELGGSVANGKGSTEELWQAFFANPLEWWDNRKNKRSPKHPDFKHKDTGEALWVDGRYNPSWVKSQLAILDEKMGSFHDRQSRSQVSSITGEDLMTF